MRKIMVVLALLGIGVFWEQPQAAAADCVGATVSVESTREPGYDLRMQYRVSRHRWRR